MFKEPDGKPVNIFCGEKTGTFLSSFKFTQNTDPDFENYLKNKLSDLNMDGLFLTESQNFGYPVYIFEEDIQQQINVHDSTLTNQIRNQLCETIRKDSNNFFLELFGHCSSQYVSPNGNR